MGQGNDFYLTLSNDSLCSQCGNTVVRTLTAKALLEAVSAYRIDSQ
jgi:hypothetical protein